jgi:hypothetical protein
MTLDWARLVPEGYVLGIDVNKDINHKGNAKCLSDR